MSKLVRISSFRPKSFSACLRQLHRDLDRAQFAQVHQYKDFLQTVRGHFLSISRKKKDISLEEAAKHLEIPWMLLEVIEKGQAPITDIAFIHLCQHYGTTHEALILTEKIEKTVVPKLQNTKN